MTKIFTKLSVPIKYIINEGKYWFDENRNEIPTYVKTGLKYLWQDIKSTLSHLGGDVVVGVEAILKKLEKRGVEALQEPIKTHDELNKQSILLHTHALFIVGAGGVGSCILLLWLQKEWIIVLSESILILEGLLYYTIKAENVINGNIEAKQD